MKRRDFLASSTLFTAGAMAGFSPAPDWTPLPLEPQQAPLPPSITALTSQRSRIRPITKEERRGRIERAKTLMAQQKIGALFLTGGTSLVYFSGIDWGLSERLLALVIPVRGTPFIVCPSFERDRAMEQVAQGPLDANTEILTWEEHENPWALCAKALRARGLGTARIGIEETVRFVFSNGLANELPQATLVSGTPISAGCRMVKDAHELELMILANELTLTAYEAAWKGITPGMQAAEFSRWISVAHERLGVRGGASVQTGEFAALPHGSIQPQIITEGTIILIDGGCSAGGYASDISRTFVVGTPTDKMKRVFDLEFKAQQAALAAARPGVPAEQVDAAARKVIADGGYGPDYKYFTHRVGHGMGMDGHEWPYLVRGNTAPLVPGNVFSDEPGIYLPGEFGVRLEDDMYITEDGAKLMTPVSRSLETPFAV
ncbi:MAG: Xaa-Pro peptidase family protein [Gemmatimonadaceae bacterium]|nr:Xaa-Pro peptidase family protein [Gemmatimonadaceae bacterium]